MNLADDTAATTLTEADLARRANWRVSLLLFLVALLARIAFLPFMSFAMADTAARTWLAWLWADHPFLITHGLWGPLHFYLIGTVMRNWADPVWAPISLHVVIGALIPAVVYRLTLELFDSRRAAMTAGLIFAVYPAAIAASVGALSETPFMLCLGLALLYLVRAWRPQGRITDALLAGLAITVASMLRYEAWLLLPFLSIPLMRRPKHAAAFVAVALMHPVFWMIGNGLAYGDPFYALSTISTWRVEIMGHQPTVGILPGAGRLWRFICETAVGLTLPASLLIAAGVICSLVKRRVEGVWLIPAFGLFLVFAASAFQDSLVVQFRYTTTFGLLLIPFVACSLEWFRIDSWSLGRSRAAAALLVASIGVFTVEPFWESLPVARQLAFRAAPSDLDKESARELQLMIERAGSTRTDEALILDFVGFTVTPGVALQTKLHPRQICKTSGQTNVPLTSAQLAAFLIANGSGVLVTRQSSKLTAHLKLESERSGTLAGIAVRLKPVGTIRWNSENSSRQFGTVTVSQYAVVGSPKAASVAPSSCPNTCPISFCE